MGVRLFMVVLLSLLVCVSSLLERDSKYILHKIITLHISNKVNGMADQSKKSCQSLI